MTHEYPTRAVGDQFRDAARPSPILGVGWLGHARGPHDIVGPEILPEHRFPINLPRPASGLTSAVNDEDGLRHGSGNHRRPESKMNGEAPPNESRLSPVNEAVPSRHRPA